MMVYEICGLTEEEADTTEMVLRRKMSGKRIGETTGLIFDQLCKEEHANPKALYTAYCYGILAGMMIGKQQLIGEMMGAE